MSKRKRKISKERVAAINRRRAFRDGGSTFETPVKRIVTGEHARDYYETETCVCSLHHEAGNE